MLTDQFHDSSKTVKRWHFSQTSSGYRLMFSFIYFVRVSNSISAVSLWQQLFQNATTCSDHHFIFFSSAFQALLQTANEVILFWPRPSPSQRLTIGWGKKNIKNTCLGILYFTNIWWFINFSYPLRILNNFFNKINNNYCKYLYRDYYRNSITFLPEDVFANLTKLEIV